MGEEQEDCCTIVRDCSPAIAACCREHDRAYEAQDVSRSAADLALFVCIGRQGRPTRAWLYWFGLRLFGWIWWRRARRYAARREATMADSCAACGAERVELVRPNTTFRIANRHFSAGVSVCAAHDLVRLCATCREDLPADRSDSVCAACRAAVDF